MSIPTIIKGRTHPTLEVIPVYDHLAEDYLTGEVVNPKLVDVIYKVDGVEVTEEEYKRVESQIESLENPLSAKVARLKELITPAEIAWGRDIVARRIPFNESSERGREKAEFFKLLYDIIEAAEANQVSTVDT